MAVDLLPPIANLTHEDKGPIVIVFTYILITNTILFTIIKLVSTATLRRRFDWDDIFVTLAALLGLAQSVLAERSAIRGVGSFQDRLSSQDLDAYFQVCPEYLFVYKADSDSMPSQVTYYQ